VPATKRVLGCVLLGMLGYPYPYQPTQAWIIHPSSWIRVLRETTLLVCQPSPFRCMCIWCTVSVCLVLFIDDDPFECGTYASSDVPIVQCCSVRNVQVENKIDTSLSKFASICFVVSAAIRAQKVYVDIIRREEFPNFLFISLRGSIVKWVIRPDTHISWFYPRYSSCFNIVRVV
jgi:hypothetical protein